MKDPPCYTTTLSNEWGVGAGHHTNHDLNEVCEQRLVPVLSLTHL